jgi:hypothetical protein
VIDGVAVETLGELNPSMAYKIKFHVTNHPDWPIKIRSVGLGYASASLCADGVVPFVRALLDAAQYEGPKVWRFGRRTVGRMDCSTWFRPITHAVQRTGHPHRPVRVSHNRNFKIFSYRLTEYEAIWLADLIANRFAGHDRSHPGVYR